MSRCGTGKTEAAIKVACERAATPYASPKTTGKRAPAHSKTLIVVPTTELAVEVTRRIRLRGVEACRIFGVTSLLREGGEHECRFHELAAALQSAGASAQYELCRGRDRAPCEHVDVCKARVGFEGDDSVRIRVTTHAQLGQQLGWLGDTGLLIIDEPPLVLDQTSFTVTELEAALANVEMLDSRYADVMTAVLDGLIRWLRESSVDLSEDVQSAINKASQELVDSALQPTDTSSLMSAFGIAHRPTLNAAPRAPQFQRRYIDRASVIKSIRATINSSGRIFNAVWQALAYAEAFKVEEAGKAVAYVAGKAIVYVDERRGERVLCLAMPNVDMYKALREFMGATVLLDATGMHQVPLYTKVLGYEPKVVEAYARDGGEVARVHLNARVTRTSIMSHGRLEIGEGLVRAVEAAVEEIARRPWCRRVLVVTFMTLELALRGALGQDVEAEWRARGQAPEVLQQTREKLGPILARLPREPAGDGVPPSPDFGHFFGVRGIDRWRDVDAVVTLGDAFGQLKDAEHLASYLGIEDWASWYRSQAAAELDQCLGRARTLRRSRPALLVAVGSVLPADWRDQRVEVIDVELRGRPAVQASVGVEELERLVDAVGGTSAAARALGCNRSTIKRYLAGERGIAGEIVERLRALSVSLHDSAYDCAQGGSENPPHNKPPP